MRSHSAPAGGEWVANGKQFRHATLLGSLIGRLRGSCATVALHCLCQVPDSLGIRTLDDRLMPVRRLSHHRGDAPWCGRTATGRKWRVHTGAARGVRPRLMVPLSWWPQHRPDNCRQRQCPAKTQTACRCQRNPGDVQEHRCERLRYARWRDLVTVDRSPPCTCSWTVYNLNLSDPDVRGAAPHDPTGRW